MQVERATRYMVAPDGCGVHAEVWFDGACSGNPGPMGGGAVIRMDGKDEAISKALGNGTNNEAEYGGLIAGLGAALRRGATSVTVRGDSQLVLRQLEGKYQVKAVNLRPYYEQAKGLLARFERVELIWVRRDENAGADAAARRAIG